MHECTLGCCQYLPPPPPPTLAPPHPPTPYFCASLARFGRSSSASSGFSTLGFFFSFSSELNLSAVMSHLYVAYLHKPSHVQARPSSSWPTDGGLY